MSMNGPKDMKDETEFDWSRGQAATHHGQAYGNTGNNMTAECYGMGNYGYAPAPSMFPYATTTSSDHQQQHTTWSNGADMTFLTQNYGSGGGDQQQQQTQPSPHAHSTTAHYMDTMFGSHSNNFGYNNFTTNTFFPNSGGSALGSGDQFWSSAATKQQQASRSNLQSGQYSRGMGHDDQSGYYSRDAYGDSHHGQAMKHVESGMSGMSLALDHVRGSDQHHHHQQQHHSSGFGASRTVGSGSYGGGVSYDTHRKLDSGVPNSSAVGQAQKKISWASIAGQAPKPTSKSSSLKSKMAISTAALSSSSKVHLPPALPSTPVAVEAIGTWDGKGNHSSSLQSPPPQHQQPSKMPTAPAIAPPPTQQYPLNQQHHHQPRGVPPAVNHQHQQQRSTWEPSSDGGNAAGQLGHHRSIAPRTVSSVQAAQMNNVEKQQHPQQEQQYQYRERQISEGNGSSHQHHNHHHHSNETRQRDSQYSSGSNNHQLQQQHHSQQQPRQVHAPQRTSPNQQSVLSNVIQDSGKVVAELEPAEARVVLDKLRVENTYNPKEFDCSPKNARFFIIKSYHEDDIHRSIKYSIWCSTEHGNKRLDTAYKTQEGKGPIYLFYSVNGSGHFCGMAQMVSSLDYSSSANVWAQDKWKGQFRVKWIYVKDVPNSQLRHIKLENNENKPVTNSRDTQEVPIEKGKQVLKILHAYRHTTSIFDDFLHYEKRQEEESHRRIEPPSRNSGSSSGGGDKRSWKD